jgi:hypothetical protein
MNGSKKDVPPGTGNPPKVKAHLVQACKQIDSIQKQLDALRKTLAKIRCEEPK